MKKIVFITSIVFIAILFIGNDVFAGGPTRPDMPKEIERRVLLEPAGMGLYNVSLTAVLDRRDFESLKWFTLGNEEKQIPNQDCSEMHYVGRTFVICKILGLSSEAMENTYFILTTGREGKIDHVFYLYPEPWYPQNWSSMALTVGNQDHLVCLGGLQWDDPISDFEIGYYKQGAFTPFSPGALSVWVIQHLIGSSSVNFMMIDYPLPSGSSWPNGIHISVKHKPTGFMSHGCKYYLAMQGWVKPKIASAGQNILNVTTEYTDVGSFIPEGVQDEVLNILSGGDPQLKQSIIDTREGNLMHAKLFVRTPGNTIFVQRDDVDVAYTGPVPGPVKYSFALQATADLEFKLAFYLPDRNNGELKMLLGESMLRSICNENLVDYSGHPLPAFCSGLIFQIEPMLWSGIPLFPGEEQESGLGLHSIKPGVSLLQPVLEREGEEEFETETGEVVQDVDLTRGAEPARPTVSEFAGPACSLIQTQDTSATTATLFAVLFTMAAFLAPIVLVRRRRK
jgi:hypothetical protein